MESLQLVDWIAGMKEIWKTLVNYDTQICPGWPIASHRDSDDLRGNGESIVYHPL